METLICLALAAYYEARSEPVRAQLAVAQVVLQRAEAAQYPDDVCQVVKQGEYGPNNVPIRHKCQFSFWCDGLGEMPRDRRAWRRAKAVAAVMLSGYRLPELQGALHYHASYVQPGWAGGMRHVATLGEHEFYAVR